MHASIHVVRNSIVMATTLIALVAAAAVAVNGALATVVALLELSLILVVLPLVVIHYEQHEERLRRSRPGQP